MKKAISLLLALAMILSLCACAGGKAPAAPAATKEPAAAVEPDTAPDGDAAPADEPVVISIANYDATNSFTIACLNAFTEYAEKASGGSITFKTYYGATLCNMMEEYEYLKAGSVDMVATLPPFYMSTLPYIYAVNTTKGNTDTVPYCNWLWFENEETAAIVEKYTAQEGVLLLGSVNAGTGVYCSTYEIASHADMTSKKLGCARDFDVYAALGLNPVNVDPPDTYDSLSRGVCDAVAYTASSYVANKIYEVAPNACSQSVYGNSNTYLISRDKWNSLSENQQQILRDAMKAAQEFSVTGDDENMAAVQEVTTTWHELRAEEAKEMCSMMETAVSVQLLASAENLGTVEEMLTILRAKESYSGIANIPDSYK